MKLSAHIIMEKKQIRIKLVITAQDWTLSNGKFPNQFKSAIITFNQ